MCTVYTHFSPDATTKKSAVTCHENNLQPSTRASVEGSSSKVDYATWTTEYRMKKSQKMTKSGNKGIQELQDAGLHLGPVVPRFTEF